MKLTRMTPVHASPASDGARRLFAALTAAVCAIAPLALAVPQVASADSVSAVTGELCTPTTLKLGDTTATSTTDTGVATYAGGNMYIGNPTSDWTTASPTGSYAAEAEGLTLVRKNFYANPLKGFFTFGTVAFGPQFRPEGKATTLAIGGNAQAWNYSAGVGQAYSLTSANKSNATTAYGALIGGSNNNLWGSSATKSVKLYSYDSYTAGTPTLTTNSSSVQSGSFKVYSSDGTTQTDYSNYGTTLSALSSQLDRLSSNGTTTVGTAEDQYGYTKYKYDGTVKASFNIVNNDNMEKKAERLITFTGDNVSPMQVFTVKASDLSSDGYKGLDFAFTDIPSGASVLVNVVDDAGNPYSGTVSYQQGWRFWWNGTEISNGYVLSTANNIYDATTAVTDAMRAAYSEAAQSIMWNYSKATSVEIKGSQATGISGKIHKVSSTSSGWASFTNASATDDPSSALLGSVLVAQGNLTTHVTTNGRVWVGGNYAMYNSENVKQEPKDIIFGTNKSASIVDMDQERHNFPWSASVTTDCSTISWNKVLAGSESSDAPTKLAGSEWKVYGSYSDAQSATSTPLLTVVDNGTNDWDSIEGQLKVQGLKPDAGYYLKESKAPDGYQLSSTIYYVSTTNTGSTDNPVMATTKDGVTYTALSNSNLPNAKTSVSWSKVDAATGTLLKGSEWTVTDSGDPARSWTVTDNDGPSYSCTASDPVDSSHAGELCDKNDAAGEFKVEGLSYNSSSGTTYTLTETKAPDGYVRSDATYSFTIAADGSVGAISSTDSSQTVPGNKITNAKTSVSWSKVDAASTDTLLEGSEWTVSTGSRDSARSWTVADNDGSSSYSCAASDPVAGSSAGGSSAGVLCDKNDAAGEFKVEGLSYNSSSGTTYTLTETKAPDEYVRSDATYSFTIAADGSVGAISSTDSSQTVPGNTITNAKAITALPKTGAWWTPQRVEIIGLGLVGLSGLGYGITLILKKRSGTRIPAIR